MPTPDALAARVMFASEAVGTPPVIRLSGELDLRSASVVENALLAVWWRATDLVVDVSGLEFCDCTGVSVFIRVAERYAADGGHLRVAAPRGIVRYVFTLSGMDEAVPIYASVAGAVEDDASDRFDNHLHGLEAMPADVLAADP